MSALWAITGPPDPALIDRIGATLAHRSGGARATVDAGMSATIAVASTCSSLGQVVRDDRANITTAFAGRLTSGDEFDRVVDAARAEGSDALTTLRGEWVVAWRTPDHLVIARDAAGTRSVYWGEANGRVIVAVEPKGVLAAPGFPRRLHAAGIAEFLTFSFVPDERTALADLYELPSGHRLEISLATGAIRLVRWFRHEAIEPGDWPRDEWVETTRAVVDRAITERVPPTEPVATFLSGGLDSSLVTAVAAAARREAGTPPPVSWSLHFGEQYPNELAYAAAVAKHAQTEHRVLEISGRTVAQQLPAMVHHLDAPIGDPVSAGNYALARVAAQESPWILNGEGGDPLFGGPKNLPMLLAHWYAVDPDPCFRETQYLATWRRAGEEVAALHPDLLAEIDFERDLGGVVRPYFETSSPALFLNKLMVANMRMKGAHLILPKVERMLGVFGAIPLSPLFDTDVLRLSLQLPPTAKLNNGVEKHVLKLAYAPLLPPEVINRRKSGMRVPVHWWFQHDLKALARDLLSPRSVQRAGVFRPERVREILRYRTGRDGLRLWMLVTFELWRRMAIDGERP